ncbi:MAG TPA: hypothetical protein P5102_03135 [Candidatus Competibacteraceae bacterium]|nr:hypothetical protein [Candidatus Competibacteraceae bacterium]HRZ05139.1 hypothetical protein [Candidatus Competibacteraceae bacterium]HSA47422.1 hypothetical protein [Candidatus Competibacteraceae bacterium]
MRRQWQAGLIMLLMLLGSTVWAQRFDSRDVEVEVVNDRGRPFPQYPLRRGGGPTVHKAHLEAVRGSNYSIRIRNRSDQRIGIVIAVDGRNIISGDRSNLRPNERMYVLEPGQRETYEGWRTGRNRVNRFYFTDAGDSYAGAWGDSSAMGVIAVAAFREVAPYPPHQPQPWSDDREGDRRGAERSMQSAPPAAAGAPRDRQAVPGTGYGEGEWSPSRRVEFEPEQRSFARFFLKYAWRDTLCQEGVIDCGHGWPRPHHRLWDENDDYAPPPPRYDRQDREEWR